MESNRIFLYLKKNRFLLLAGLIILIGICFRVVMFLQNRNLIIDEANVVRNIYERSLPGLLKPLSYEQYAPPLYLWQLEVCSWIFGYSEYAMRLPALIWGVAALFVFYAMARRVMTERGAWMPLGLLAFAPIFIKYSAEVKQYGPDAFTAIALIYCALQTNIFTVTRRRFLLTWAIAGSIAIWNSQPSVFILASVGAYYFAQCAQQRRWDYWKLLLPIALIWFAQFAVYYELILKPQINSDYLQNYHHDYFLYAIPDNAEEWRHNWIRIQEILHNTVGYSQRSYYLSMIFMVTGAVALIRRSLPLFLLLCMPIMITLIAAALKQFSLIERVALFMLPFTMLLTGYGFSEILKVKLQSVRFLFICIGLNMLWEYNFRQLFYERFLFQELTIGFDFLLKKNVTGKELYVDCTSRDTYIYYTEIHPDRKKYEPLKGAYLYGWAEDDYRPALVHIKTPEAFLIFTGGSEEQRAHHVEQVKDVMDLYKSYDLRHCFIFEFVPKNH
ncbi:glycosyltransferase family 39 protein [Rurimicrobium arvi]|uniref:Glycosyltransferase RgtA/B/C/D-like domain-containing protein n=1 Tax=Rurimicrobium arvi TaxID=2049916 RepID=A0ABP8MFL7_9BACT